MEFKGRLQSCYEANLKLRTAHRILMRIAGFKATNFRALQKKTEALSWALYLPPGRPLQIRVASKHSRLYHTAALEECIRKAINTRLAVAATQQNPRSRGESPLVFVRLHKDFFSLSVDSSGDLLHRRGIKSYPAKAPIRETIASAALLFAGYDGKRPLLDPMCGSGTFSFKAAMMARNMPPGWFRDFAFMNSGLPFALLGGFIRKRSLKKDFRGWDVTLIAPGGIFWTVYPFIFISDRYTTEVCGHTS